VFGGVILLVYGITNFFKKSTGKSKAALNTRSGGYLYLFIKGFILNLINVGVLVFWLGVIIIVGPSLDNDPNRLLIFFSGMLGAYLGMDILKILLAKQLKRKLTRRRIFLVKKGLGILLVICGLVLITKGFLPKDQLNFEKGIEMIRDKNR
jgi:threonine/homoserine/homoserine lactone efflux protein